MRFEVPTSMKYFCMSEAIAFYLQKYITYRKRKIYYGKQRFVDLIGSIKKHKSEKFLLPSSDILKPVIPQLLEENDINYTRVVLYKTVCSDLSDLENVFYDVLVFFSPSGIKSLFQNFPKKNSFQILEQISHNFGHSSGPSWGQVGAVVDFVCVFFRKKKQDLGGAEGDFANKAKWSSNDSGYSRDSPRGAQKCIYCLP